MLASSDSIHNVKICSFNLHGFNTGLSYIARMLCKSYDIIILQEHWLLKDTLTNLNLIGSDFAYVEVSSMSRKASLGLISGRPLGGVAILWRKSPTNYVTLCEKDDENGRFISVLFNGCFLHELVFSGVCFPCFNLKHSIYVVAASAVIAFVDNHLNKCSDAYHVIGDDLTLHFLTLVIKVTPYLLMSLMTTSLRVVILFITQTYILTITIHLVKSRG
jgi:hypothetical protein